MTSTAPVPPLETTPLSEVERVVDTFVAPVKTFTDLRRSANWLVPAVLLILGTLALVFVAERKLGFERISENQLALQPKQAARLDQLSPEDRARQMQLVIKINRIGSYVSPAIVLIFLIIIAAVLLGTFNFGLGAELRFGQCLAVVMYASLPGVIKELLAILALAMGGGAAFTFQNPVASNLSGLVDINSHFLYSVSVAVDVFNIWTLILTGIGFSCLTKLKRETCLAVVFGWWITYVLVASGLSAAFS